ncbi:MAG: hypothetical protein JNK58_06815, partial [Phycisphaerae bacterium]|nr:hypothetical protein [Phycisphaerae bacterium]
MNVRTWTASLFGVMVGLSAATAIAEPQLSSRLAEPTEQAPQPLAGHDRGVPDVVVFDGGAPDLQNANECTSWIQANRFTLGDSTTLTTCTFWTLDINAWDGNCQFFVYEDVGGTPGAVLYSGSVGLYRSATGRFGVGFPEFENQFVFPPGVTLGAGNYMLGLHMASTCGGTFDIGWETSTGAGVASEQFGCAGAWGNYEVRHAFVLYGQNECPPPMQAINGFPNGVEGVPLNPTLTWNNPGCDVLQNVVNGGFETGDFTGWGIITGPGGELSPWSVGGTGWFGDAGPAEGAFWANNGFDGDAGLNYEAYQEVYVPVGANDAAIMWQDRIRWDGLGIVSSLPRTYRVTIQPQFGGSPLETIYAFDFYLHDSGNSLAGDTGYVFHFANLAAYQGQTVRIVWRQDIPETFTGPANFQLDDVRFGCVSPARPVIAPDRAKAFDETFEQARARYAAAHQAAQARPANTSPAAASNNALADAPIALPAERGIGFGNCGELFGAATGTGAGGGTGPSSLYRIDPLTGAATLIGPIGFNGVSGITFMPDGTLYGACNSDAIYGPASSALIRIDPNSGAGTLIGKISDSASGAGRITDISVGPNGTLYGYGDAGNEGLYIIDTNTGAGSFVGFSGTFGGGNGMDFDLDGRLYQTAWDNGCLHELDPLTGASSCVPGTQGTLPQAINALDFNLSTGTLYGSLRSDVNYLITIDKVNGGYSTVGATVLGLDAIAFRCSLAPCSTVFVGGAPNLVDAYEMTGWEEADDFVLFEPTRVTGGRFWTLEIGAWDGTLEYRIYKDAGGLPGLQVAAGLASADRTLTGRSAFGLIEQEWRFELPAPGLLLPPGTYWLGLHASADCGSFDGIYWENGSPAFGQSGQFRLNCAGGWTSSSSDRAFQICGETGGGCCGALYGAATGTG